MDKTSWPYGSPDHDYLSTKIAMVLIMVLILDGNSVHGDHALRKMGLFG